MVWSYAGTPAVRFAESSSIWVVTCGFVALLLFLEQPNIAVDAIRIRPMPAQKMIRFHLMTSLQYGPHELPCSMPWDPRARRTGRDGAQPCDRRPGRAPNTAPRKTFAVP